MTFQLDYMEPNDSSYTCFLNHEPCENVHAMNQQVARQDSNAMLRMNSQASNEHVPQSKSPR